MQRLLVKLSLNLPLLAALLFGVVVTRSSVANAQEFAASMQPTSLRLPTTQRLTYRLDMRAGSLPLRYQVDMRVPVFGAGMRSEGSLITPDGWRLEGDVKLLASVRFFGIPACSPTYNRPHGEEIQNGRVRIEMAPGTAGAIVADYKLSSRLPWPSTDLRLIFAVTPLNSDGRPDPTIAEQLLRPPAPTRAGKRGVQIVIRSTPRLKTAGRLGSVIRRGHSLRLNGRLSPRLPGQRVTLRYLGPQNLRRFRTLAVRRTNRHGQIPAIRWKPRWPGGYEVWAFTPARPSAKTVEDYSCPLTFRVR
jgi:hypothetical protein